MRAARFFLGILAILSLVFPAGSFAALQFVDSGVVTVRTSAPSAPTINLSCSARTDSTVTVSWSENLTGSYTLNLYQMNTPNGNRLRIATGNPPLTPGIGSYEITNLSAGTAYYYVMTAVPPAGSTIATSAVVECSTLSAGSDAPSLLYVWPAGPTTLYVNWKDNAVRPHTFTLERIKLTPKQPEWRLVNGKKIETIGSNAIRLYWKNETNTQSEKGPYYHEFERSTSSDPNIRFGPQDFSSTTVERAFPEDVTVTGSRVNYDTTDTGLEDATEYWYRLRGCSSLRVDLTRESPTETDDASEKACGLYADEVLATTTLPADPRVEFLSYGERELTFRFLDNSRHEDGYEVRVSPCPPGATCTGGIYETLSSIAGSGTWTTKTLGGLSYGTEYTVEVRAFRNPRAVTGKIYSAWVGGTRTTKPYLATDPGEGGSISPSCAAPPGSPTCFREYNIANNSGFVTETVTATPSDNNFEFLGLSGCDNYTQGETSCDVTVNTGRTVSALYRRIAWDYSITTVVNGVNQGTVPDNCAVGSEIECPAEETTTGCTTDVSGCSPPGEPVPCAGYAITITKTGQSCTAGGGSGFSPLKQNPLKALARGVWQEFEKLAAIPHFEVKLLDLSSAPPEPLALRGSRAVAGAFEKLRAFFFGTERALASVTFHTVGGIGPSPSSLNAYFARTVRSGLNPAQYPSVYRDDNVTPNTVYLYRVKAVYNAGGETAYSLEGAGKTFPAGGTSNTVQVRVCTRNSFCDRVNGTSTTISGEVFSPLNTKDGARFQGYGQCRNNNDCRDVHTSRQFFEER